MTETKKNSENSGMGRDMVQGEGRLHLHTPLMRESLMSHAFQGDLISEKNSEKEVALLPWATLINIGGSVLDRGASALLPLLDEIVKFPRDKDPLIVSVGGGVRLRHTMEIGQDLGLPIGGLAQIAGAIEEQNSHMVHALLSKHGGISMCREHFAELPKYLLTGMIPIIVSIPPYHFWEPPPREGDIPENRSDLGAYMTAEVLGVKRMIFIKDQPGHFDKNPADNPDAKLIENCRVADLMPKDSADLILERAVLQTLNRARNVREIHVINGLEKGALTAVCAGKKVGTLIRQDDK